jgi:hypothetical protein
MLSAVDFDDQSRFSTFEIDDVWLNRRLTTKMKTELSQFAQSNPKLYFLRRKVLAQSSRALVRHSTPPDASLPLGATLP